MSIMFLKEPLDSFFWKREEYSIRREEKKKKEREMIYNSGWIHKPILIKPVRFEAVDFIFSRRWCYWKYVLHVF